MYSVSVRDKVNKKSTLTTVGSTGASLEVVLHMVSTRSWLGLVSSQPHVTAALTTARHAAP